MRKACDKFRRKTDNAVGLMLQNFFAHVWVRARAEPDSLLVELNYSRLEDALFESQRLTNYD